MKITVTGYRSWSVPETVERVLGWWALDMGVPAQLSFGDCPTGPDRIAKQWCQEHGIPFTEYVANWSKYSKAAGPIRNQEMIDTEEPDVVLAFLHPKSKGAKSCARYARSKGYRVIEIWENLPE